MSRQDLKHKHRTAETSLQALKRKKKNGTEVSDRERCKAIIEKYGPITAEEMEIHMGKTQSKFAGRIRTLKDNHKVEVVGKKPNSNGIQVQLLDIKKETEADASQDSNVIFSEKEEQSETSEQEQDYLLKDKKTGEVIC